MLQKRVSFEIAKALKEAGYPQNIKECPFYNEEGTLLGGNYDFWKFSRKFPLFCIVPTYIDVWLWLWREKGFRFELAHPEYKGEYDFNKLYCNVTSGRGVTDDYSDPEEAIIEAVEYICKNDLIK